MWPCPAGNQAPVLWWEPAYCLARLSHQAHRRRGDPPAARYQTHSNKVRRSVQITLIWPFRCSVTAQCKCLEPPISLHFASKGPDVFVWSWAIILQPFWRAFKVFSLENLENWNDPNRRVAVKKPFLRTGWGTHSYTRTGLKIAGDRSHWVLHFSQWKFRKVLLDVDFNFCRIVAMADCQTGSPNVG